MITHYLTLLRFRISSPLLKSNSVVFPLPLLHFSTSLQPHSALYEFLVQKHDFSPKSASQIASVVTRFRNLESCDSVLSFFRESGFSISQLEKTVKFCPQLLSANLEKSIKPKFNLLKYSGASADDVVKIISCYPGILRASVNNKLVPSLSVLKSLFGADELVKLLKVSAWLLLADIENNFIPNVELLKDCGVSMDRIKWMMRYCPRDMLSKHDAMKKFVDKADAMGVNRSSKKFLDAVRVIGGLSDETWELKMSNFRNLGFSDDDISVAFRRFPNLFGFSVETWKLKLSILRKIGFTKDNIKFIFRCFPQAFGLSEERIKKVIEVLLANGKYNLSCIGRCPMALGYNIENRYKPRMQVLELLEGKNLIQNWPALSTLSTMTDKRFHNKFVAPYLHEIGDKYMQRSVICS